MKLLCCASVATVMLTIGCGPSSNSQSQTTEPPAPTAPAQSKEQALAYRLEWNRQTLVTDYEQRGRRDPKWDAHATNALDGFAQLRCANLFNPDPLTRGLLVRVTEATRAAVTNGCDDPMIRYLHVRYILPEQEHDPLQHAEAFREVAESMSKGGRATVRRYFAALRGAEYSNVGTAAALPEIQRWRDEVGSSRVDLQACKLEYSIVSPK